MSLFQDRADAGRKLAARLESLRAERPVVLALPRGGVVVGSEVARALDAPLDVLVVRKLGAPDYPEYAIGAVAHGAVVLNDEVRPDDLPAGYMQHVIEEETRELERRERLYRGDRPRVPVTSRTVIVVDDGLATGSTAAAAVAALRRSSPGRIVLAVPVAAPDAVERLRGVADDVVCVAAPDDFRAVSLWYADFDQTTDDEVIAMLRAAPAPASA